MHLATRTLSLYRGEEAIMADKHYSEGQADLISRLVHAMTHTISLVVAIIDLLIKSPGPSKKAIKPWLIGTIS